MAQTFGGGGLVKYLCSVFETAQRRQRQRLVVNPETPQTGGFRHLVKAAHCGFCLSEGKLRPGPGQTINDRPDAAAIVQLRQNIGPSPVFHGVAQRHKVWHLTIVAKLYHRVGQLDGFIKRGL